MTASGICTRTQKELEKFKSDPDVGVKFKRLINQFPEWLEISNKIKGVPKSIGKHPAGIVVGDESLRNLVPLQKAKGDKNYVTEWIDGTYRKELTETLKLVKFDLLGLSNLGIIQGIISLIRENHKDTDKLDLSLSDTEVMTSIPLESGGLFDNAENLYISEVKKAVIGIEEKLRHILEKYIEKENLRKK